MPCAPKIFSKHPNNLTMAAAKAHTRPQVIKQKENELSDASSESDLSAETSGDESQPDSDSLDSQASRKRRKISPAPDDDEPRIPISFISSVPSRIKSKFKSHAINKETNPGAILAPTDPQTSFASLDVKPWLVASLSNMAIKRPTGIQKGCIPEILKGRDCIGGSRTGSGKTVAFAVPILQKWAEDPIGTFGLVLTPTR
jgi:ATP-dependent RNA helicase DDX49/DBP8